MTYTGYLKLEVENRQNKSILTNRFFDGVFKVTRPTYLSNELPLLTLIHVGGGYVDGDSYQTEVILNEFSKLALTTQASTKVYKSPCFGVTQTTDYFLKEGSELYVKQDSLIPYRGANFSQYTNVYMSSSAVFSYSDIITPGWSEDGKLFQYKKVTSKMKIFVNGKLMVFDHLLLEPKEKLDQIMVLEGYTHIGTMLFIHEGVDESFITDLRMELSNNQNEIRAGISLLGIPGVSIRILATSTPVIEAVFSKCESSIRKYMKKREIEWRKG